jgi:AcrR family transcriptional regulator
MLEFRDPRSKLVTMSESNSSADGQDRTEAAAGPAAMDSIFYRPDRAKRSSTGLSRERIVAAAVDFLDREGPGALTMRKFAADLGVHPTSLYWYVKRREDLIDLAIDETLAGAAGTPVREAAWDAIVTETATSMYRAFTSHPWVASFAGARPLVGPNALTLTGRVLAALASTGAPDRALAIAGTTISNFILGSATAAGAAAALGLTEPDSPLARETVSRVSAVFAPPASSAAWDPFFDESLQLVMSGVRSLLVDPARDGS